MTRIQSALLLFIVLLTISVFFTLTKPKEWSSLEKEAFPQKMTQEEVVNVLGSERVAYKVGASGNVEVRESELPKAELLLTGLRAIQNLKEGHSTTDVLGEFVVQRYLKSKIDELMNSLVGEGGYISEVYVTPTNSSLAINKRIKPHDLVTYFLNSPGVKRIYFRLVIDSDIISSRELDPEFIESRVKRHLRTLLHDLKGVRLTEEITFIPFQGTGLSSIAQTGQNETRQEQWLGKFLIPLLLVAALLITTLIVLLAKKKNQQTQPIQKKTGLTFNQDFKSINFEEEQNDTHQYLQLKKLPPGVIESFTESADIGNILLFLQPKEAAAFLQMLTFEQQVKSIGECLGYHHLDVVEKERVIEKVAKKVGVENLHDMVIKNSSIKHVAKILNELQPANSNRILQELHHIDAKSLVSLKNEFFVLTSLIPLGGEGIKHILTAGGGGDLLLAVNDSDSQIKEKVIALVPKTARAKLSEDLAKVDSIKIQAAQLRIAKLIAEFNRKQVEQKQNYQKVK